MGDDNAESGSEMEEENVEEEKETSLSVEDLRKQLDGPDFLVAVRHFFCDKSDSTHVLDYIVSGGSVTELAQLLAKLDLKKKSQTVAIFSAIRLVIIKTLIELPEQKQQLNEQCKDFVTEYVVDIVGQIVSKTPPRHKIICLKLIAALASVSDSLALQLLSSISLSKEAVESLAKQVDPFDEDSVRVNFIRFLLSFIIDHSAKIIHKLCSNKTWLPSIFADMKYDLFSTVSLTLTTLENGLLKNPNVAKTQKMFVFNSKSLVYLYNLYNWAPTSFVLDREVNVKKIKIQATDPVDETEVREMVHNFLLILVSSTKLGVIFSDPSYGTSNLEANHMFAYFLKEVGQSWRDPMKIEVISKLLSSCPDLVHVFCSYLTESCSNFSLNDWLNVTDLLHKVLEGVEFNEKHFHDVKFAQRVTSRVLFPCTKLLAIANKGSSKSTGTDFRPPMLKVYKSCLKKISSIGDHLAANSSDVAVREEYFSRITPEIHEVWPSSDLFLASIVVSYSAKNEEGFNLALDCLFLYANLFPTTIDIIKYEPAALENVQKMVNYFVKSTEEVFTERQIALIKLIELEILIDPQIIKKGGTVERLKELCDIILVTTNEDTRMTAVKVVRRLLDITNIFAGNTTEMDLWIYCLTNYLEPRDGSTLAKAVSYAHEKKFEIANVILRCRPDTNNEMDEVIASLEDFLSMENDMGHRRDLSGQIVTHSSLSPLLPAFIRVMSSIEDDRSSCVNLVTAFIVLSFHSGTPSKLLKEAAAQSTDIRLKPALSYVESPLTVALEFPPFSGTIFNQLAKSVIDPAAFQFESSELDSAMSEKLTGQILAYAIYGLHKKSLAFCVNLLEKIVRKCSPTSLSRCLSRVELINRFHPILKTMSGRDLSSLVLALSSTVASTASDLTPYSIRFYTELKYALKTKQPVKTDLRGFFAVFPPSHDDVRSLLTFISSPNFRESLPRENWAVLTTQVLSHGAKLRLAFKNSHLSRIVDEVRSFVNSQDSSDLLSSCGEYVSAMGEELDINGQLLDSLKELLAHLCSADHWSESLAVTLAVCICRSGQQLNFLPAEFPLNRQVTILTAAKTAAAENHHSSIKYTLSFPAVALTAFLKTLDPPEWLESLPGLIVDGHVESHLLEHLAKKIEKKSDSILPTKRTLTVVQRIYSSCNLEMSLARLLHKWLTHQMTFETGLSGEICEVYSEIKSDSLEFPWTEDLVKFLVNEALSNKKPTVLHLLNRAVKSSWTPFDPSFTFELVASHSDFMSILMTRTYEATKRSMLALLLALVQIDKSLMKTGQLALFFSAYGGTLTACDQIILKILQEYEKSGVNLSSYEPYLWGEAAVEHYSVHRKPEMSRSSPQQTLDILQSNLLLLTIANFPLDRDLTGDCAENDKVYDPAFLLPVLCQVARPGCKISTRAVFQSGAVSIVFSSLASRCQAIRTAALTVLNRLHANTRGKDHALWRDIIECIRRGVVDLMDSTKSTSEVPRISSVAAVFLARASLVLTKPFHPMYEPLHAFLRAKPAVNLKSVPAFLELFHSTHVENHEAHRQWILEVIKEGLRERADLNVVLFSMAFKLILDFHSSILASSNIKAIIEDIVKKCLVEADKDNHLLILEYSLLPWILSRAPRLCRYLPDRFRSSYRPMFAFLRSAVDAC